MRLPPGESDGVPTLGSFVSFAGTAPVSNESDGRHPLAAGSPLNLRGTAATRHAKYYLKNERNVLWGLVFDVCILNMISSRPGKTKDRQVVE
jgi:hypothetical protein